MDQIFYIGVADRFESVIPQYIKINQKPVENKFDNLEEAKEAAKIISRFNGSLVYRVMTPQQSFGIAFQGVFYKPDFS